MDFTVKHVDYQIFNDGFVVLSDFVGIQENDVS